MDTLATARLEVDLHRLELRFASARLLEPHAVEQLARSIERCGQVIPCIAVPEAGGEPLVLVDGYRRIAALRRLGRDTALVERWACDIAQALISVLSRAQGRTFAAIEEALLLRELIHGQGLSQHELARRCGRDVSWVCRRLQLLSALPDAMLVAVREGALSTWAATRVFAPLARANPEHAERLLAALHATPLSPANCAAGSNTIRAPIAPCANASSATRGCFSKRCTAAMSRAHSSACAPVPKANVSPIYVASKQSSLGCVNACQRCMPTPCRRRWRAPLPACASPSRRCRTN